MEPVIQESIPRYVAVVEGPINTTYKRWSSPRLLYKAYLVDRVTGKRLAVACDHHHESSEPAYRCGRRLLKEMVKEIDPGPIHLLGKAPTCVKCGKAIRKSEYMDPPSGPYHIVCP